MSVDLPHFSRDVEHARSEATQSPSSLQTYLNRHKRQMATARPSSASFQVSFQYFQKLEMQTKQWLLCKLAFHMGHLIFAQFQRRALKPLDRELKMAQKSRKDMQIASVPKNTRQGEGRNTKYTATSRNGKPKRYRGQGKK